MSAAILPLPRPMRAARAAAFAFVLVLAADAVLLVALLTASAPDHDAIQSIGAARSLLAGQGYASPIVYYDAQLEAGPPLPVPQTVFPPGASWAIAGLMAAGVPAAVAPGLLAIVGLFASAEATRRLLRLGGVPPTLAAAVAIGWLAHPRVWELTRAGATEPLFVAALLAAILALSRAAGAARPAPALAAAGIAGAAAVTVRYVGVVPVAAFAAVAWFVFRHAGPMRAVGAALWVGGPAALAAAAMFVRNRMLTGRLSGGQFEQPSAPGLGVAVDAMGEAARRMLAVPALPGAGAAALVGAALVLVAGIVWALRAARRDAPPEARVRAALVLACATAAIAHVAFHAANAATVATWFASWRYLLPMLPAGLVVAAVAGSALLGERTVRRAGAAALVAAIGLAIVSGWREARQVTPLATAVSGLEAALDTRCGERTLRERLAALPAGEPVLSNEEHLLHLATGRPTLGTVSRFYGARSWSAGEVASTMALFGAREAVMLASAFARREAAFAGQPFHETFAAGGVPDGFEQVCAGPGLRVLRRAGS